MTLDDIPLLSLAVLKHNIPNYAELSDTQILEYFNNKYDVFILPKLPDEDKALAILNETIATDGLILIACDYDCDGLSSAAIGYKALKHKCNNYKVIHNKRSNGNGFTKPFMESISKIHKETPIALLISADHGSNNVAAVDEMHAMGITNVIITDHHTINGDGVTNADAFVSPLRGCPELGNMCGAYVLFKLLSGLYKEDPDIFNKLYRPCLPHVAVATVADVMCMTTDYNRLVVRAGVQLMNIDDGLWGVLADKLNAAGLFKYKDMGFLLAPFINTGNRSSREELFYSILVEEDLSKLSNYIDQGIKINISRKKIKKEALSAISQTLDVATIGNSLSLIVNTSMAINGVIAGNLGETHQVPATCFIRNFDKDTLSGSSRGVLPHINIAQIYKDMAAIDNELFLGHGGHPGAGGCGIPFAKFDRFKELFELVVSKIPKPEAKDKAIPIINISTKFLNYGIVEDLNFAGPIGKDWEIPLLRGRFKFKSVLPLRGMAILTMIAANGRVFKCTYFYKDDDPRDDINNWMPVGNVVYATFEPQYYKRYNRLNFTLLIHSIEES